MISKNKNVRNEEVFKKNKKLNDIEINQNKTVLKSKPTSLRVTLTTRCNLRCVMCKAWRRSWDIQKKTVEEIVALFPYLQKILWQGGEIFLSEYFEDLFEKAASYPNLRQDINTNGLFINEEWIKRFAKTNICLIYSIDGVTKDIYEYIRGGARFEDLLKSLSLIKEYKERCNFDENKIKTIINVVIMRSNYFQLEQFVDFAYEYKFNILQLTPIEGEFGPENIFFHKDSQITEYIEKVLPQVLNKAKDYGIITFNCLPRINDYSLDSIKLDAKNKSCEDSSTEYNSSTRKTGQILCSWPWQNLFIDQWGNVRPECLCREEKHLGNIYKSTLEEIWNNEMMQLYRKKILDNDYMDLCNFNCFSGIIVKESLKLG